MISRADLPAVWRVQLPRECYLFDAECCARHIARSGRFEIQFSDADTMACKAAAAHVIELHGNLAGSLSDATSALRTHSI